MNNSYIEVLAPVGSRESLEAAVRAGADAVYLGREQFSARRNAENFDNEALAGAVRYCHIRGVKVYLTLNIMLKENELSDALALVSESAASGIDGVIIADLGLAKLLKKAIPDLPLHASTQMTVHSPSALAPLKALGFERVVIARELSLKSIKEICDEAKRLQMTVEAFVHGALCMSVSGQCLLSAVLGSRSGNRGLCAGPCRLPFSVKGGTGYDLSLKDLSYFSYITELREAGVISLKIEGRMKRPEYVAAATAACRSAVDNGFVPEDLSLLLRDVFSRSGFTDGYLCEKIGKEMFGIRTKDDVVSASDAFPILHNLYRNERQSVDIDMSAEIKRDMPLSLTLSDGSHTVTVKGDIPSVAKSKPCDEQTVKANLSKLGGTPYRLKNFEAHIDNNLYIPLSALNALRRTATEQLDALRGEVLKYNISSTVVSTNFKSSSKTPTTIARFENVSQIPKNVQSLDGIMLPLEADLPVVLPSTSRLIVDIPRGILSEEYIKNRLAIFKEKGFNYAYCGNLAAIKIANDSGFNIIGGIGLNAANTETVSVLHSMGVNEITISPEILLSETVRLNTKIPKGIFAYGKLPLMLMRNCPVKNGSDCDACQKNSTITDRLGIEFPIKCRVGFSELYNSLPIFLADRQNEYSGLDFILLYFTDESSEHVSKIINMYKNGGNPPEKHTRGLYYRSVM